MADNFDLKKFLKESKALENLNPTLKSLNENSSIKEKIKEMILAELGNPDDGEEEDTRIDYSMGKTGDNQMPKPPKSINLDIDDEEDTRIDYSMGKTGANQMPKPPKSINLDIDEAKKKDEEVEDVETTDVETTDVETTDTTKEEAPEEEAPEEDAPEEDAPAEETPATGGGLEDIAADMEGTEGDLMDYLMKALKVAKGMNNEKLETQIGNTLKFFVSEYIGGEEQ